MNFLSFIATLAQLLPAIHAAIDTLAPLFPKAKGGVDHVNAVVQQVTAVVNAAQVATSGTAEAKPDAHVTAVVNALPGLVAVVASIKTAADAFNAQQQASAGT